MTSTARRARSLLRAYRRRRFLALFVLLILGIASHAAAETAAPVAAALEWLLALSLGAAVLSIELGRRARVLLVLAGGFLAFRLAHPWLGIASLLVASEALFALAALVAVGLIAGHALRGGRVDSERIFAALDAYLLAAVMFGVVYALLDREFPGSFGPEGRGPLAPQSAAYLSLVVISTLGFGDIVPLSGTARGLVTVEAVGGQMYLAVLVARLVSLYSAHEFARGTETDDARR
jgi:hypothetical protein